jgi:hypothetical protein
MMMMMVLCLFGLLRNQRLSPFLGCFRLFLELSWLGERELRCAWVPARGCFIGVKTGRPARSFIESSRTFYYYFAMLKLQLGP